MSSSNTEKIIQLAKEKTAEKEKLAIDAIEDLKKDGRKITFYSVAKETGLSKTFLYNNESVRQEIEESRETVPSSDKTAKMGSSLDADQLLNELEKMKEEDPDGYERIRATLMNVNPEED